MTLRVAPGLSDREDSLTKKNVTIENRIYILSAHSLSKGLCSGPFLLKVKCQAHLSFPCTSVMDHCLTLTSACFNGF